MAYTTLTEFNRTGIEGLMLYVADVVPPFIPMLFFTIFIIIFFGIYTIQRSFQNAFAVAGIITAVCAFFLSLIEGLVPSMVLIPTLVIAIVGIAILFLAGKDDSF